jgi:hypothetical protein
MMKLIKRLAKYTLLSLGSLVALWVVLKLLFPPAQPPSLKTGPPPLAHFTPGQKELLSRFLDSAGLAPAEYICRKFRESDVVMLGELHRIQHDPIFVQSLLPELYRHGVYRLGFEFSNLEDQDNIDRLLSAPAYDEAAAIRILRNLGSGMFPWKEYLDIYRAAWELNAALPPESPPFRVIALMPLVDGEKLNTGTAAERAMEKYRMTMGDSVMAAVIEREAFGKGMKMLVYCGENHGFTRFRQPFYTEDSLTFGGGFAENRAGQRLLRNHPGRVVTVLLHSPQMYPAYRLYGYPFGGILDQVFAGHPVARGFDIPGTPFADLVDSMSLFAIGYGSVRFSDYCDGYIILGQPRNYKNVTSITDWFQDVSFSDFKNRFITPLPPIVFHPWIFMYLLKSDADIESKFKDLPPLSGCQTAVHVPNA